MAKYKFLLTAFVACLALGFSTQVLPAAASTNDTACTRIQVLAGACPAVSATTDPDGVTLRGSLTLPGASGGNRSSLGNRNRGASALPQLTLPGRPSAAVPQQQFRGVVRDDYIVISVTLSDLVNFRPAAGTDQMEPNGWTVVGLETNFYSQARVQVQSGLLLGRPATVRFTPVRYRWDYGDGQVATRATPGATWEALGVDEFEPTATSHVYRVAGNYRIGLTVYFAAEYRFDSNLWVPIAGTVPVQANELLAVTGTAKTVLVERECTESLAGPGC